MLEIKDDGDTFEEIMEECSSLRYGGTPMLINRTLNEFTAFVNSSIFDSESQEQAFYNAYGGYVGNDETKRLRRWALIFREWCRQEYMDGGKNG